MAPAAASRPYRLERAQFQSEQQRDQLDRRRRQCPGPRQVVGLADHRGEQRAGREPGRPAEDLDEGVSPPRKSAKSSRGASVIDMISMERPTVGCQPPSPPSWRARVWVTAPSSRPPMTKATPVVRTSGMALDRVALIASVAGLVEAEEREQAVEEGDGQGRTPDRVVAHLPESRPGRSTMPLSRSFQCSRGPAGRRGAGPRGRCCPRRTGPRRR